MLLGQHAVADDRHRLARGELPRQLDRERVHGHGPDRPAALAGDQHLGAGQVAAEAVRIPDRDQADPRVLLGGVTPAVAGALARVELLDLGQAAAPAENRLEPVLRGIRPERREAVQRDAAAGGLEAGVGDAERGGRVRRVADELRVAVGRLAEELELAAGEDGVRVGRRQVRHEPDDVLGGLRELRVAEAPHPGVELQVHGDGFGDPSGTHDELEPRLAGGGLLVFLRRPHDQDAGLSERVSQRNPLRHRDDAECRGARLQRSAGRVARPVPVAVCLDDRPQLGALQFLEQPRRVSSQRAEVNRDLRTHPEGPRSRRRRPSRAPSPSEAQPGRGPWWRRRRRVAAPSAWPGRPR